MCTIKFKATVTDSGNSPYEVGEELLVGIAYKREAQLEYDFSDEHLAEPMCEASIGIQRLGVSEAVL